MYRRINCIVESEIPPEDNVLWLKEGTIRTLINGKWVDIAGSEAPAQNLREIDDYLYYAEYKDLDYTFAKNYFLSGKPLSSPSGCSSFSAGNFLARSYDWEYNNSVEFVIKTFATKNRYAVIGVAGNVQGLTKFTVDRRYDDMYRILPFRLVDGVNEKGLACNINVVPTDKGLTTHTTPLLEARDSISIRMLPRYILDNFSTVEEAIGYLQNYIEVYGDTDLQNKGYDIHVMLKDATSTYVLEIVNNVLVANQASIMTNFHIDGVEFNDDGTVYTPADVENKTLPTVENKITEFGAGLERYNLIAAAIEDIQDKAGVRTLLSSLHYSNAYKDTTTPFWYSEFVGKYGTLKLTVDSKPSDFTPVINVAKENYQNRSRETSTTWHTVHNSIYDITTKELTLTTQEGSREYTFTL